MAEKNLPTPEELHNLLRYEPETGRLYWRERTPDMFSGPLAAREAHRFNTRFAGKEVTSKFAEGYGRVNINNATYLAHRVAWAMAYGEWPSAHLDHINGVRSDNRIENLRLSTPLENARNRTINRNNKSGCSGVFWRERNEHWQANIRHLGRTIHLGCFVEKFDAVLARLQAERQLGYTGRR